MATVRTVSGDIDAADLGRTSMHEHVLGTFDVWHEDVVGSPSVSVAVDADAKVGISNLGLLHRNPLLLHDNLVLDDEDLAAKEVQSFKDAGGSCLVEVSSVGIRTDPEGIRRIAERTDLWIVAGASFYLEGCHPPRVATSTIDELASEIIQRHRSRHRRH